MRTTLLPKHFLSDILSDFVPQCREVDCFFFLSEYKVMQISPRPAYPALTTYRVLLILNFATIDLIVRSFTQAYDALDVFTTKI